MEVKRCKICNKTKPKTDEYFRRNGKSWRSGCKECINKNLPKKTEKQKKERKAEMQKKWALKNRPRKTEKNPTTKKCCSCKIVKPRTDEFFRRRSDYKNNFRHECKECFDEKNRKRHLDFYKKNTEKEKLRHKTWIMNNPEKRRKSVRRCYLKNIDRRKKYDIERMKNLTDSYVANVSGYRKDEMPAYLIEQKRIILKLKRELKMTNYGR